MPSLSECHSVSSDPDSICKAANSSYGFQPELWVGIVFSALYGLEMLIHAGLLAFHRGYPKFMIVAIVAAAGELAGWIARTYGHVDPFDWNGYVAQIICLILSPAFISAVNYMAFQNVMDVFGSKWSRIPRKYYVIGFCIGDLCSLVVQAVGGALSAEAETQSEITTGSNAMIAGVSVQVAVTAPFMLLYLDYNIRRLREWSTLPKHERPHRKVEILNAVIGISTLFILVRCIYRIVEMAEGWLGYLATTPVYFDILDGLMILFAIGIFIPFYPGRLLPRDKTKGTVYNAADDVDIEKPQRSESETSQTTPESTTPSGHSSLGGHSNIA
ncbi:uncharacterized protein SPSC_06173 [Sporisorium scitamineum]|uniref:RTA1-involved in 7-aminocholesterol resistance n=1 Tax=Sporisorium scitamineum TaxID=49012 RepID=A0A0F7S0A2_9BASI|nr:uncharacterized protein SPSC_06173 [Sporisorium scitamineum]CDW95088.1 hypothetical protein [Sporisorium scitamineum]